MLRAATVSLFCIAASPVFAAGLGDLTSAASSLTDGSTTEAVIEQAMGIAFPGVDVPPYVPCVAKNVSADDTTALTEAGLSGDYAAAASTVQTIATKPETTECFTSSSLPALTN